MNIFVFTSKDTLDISRQRVRLLSILFIFFLPFPVRWQRPRVKFAALPPSPTWWSPSRETRLTTNCLPRVGGPHHYAKHLWKDGTICLEGGGEFGGTSNATTPGGSAASMPTAPPTSETAVWGITWVLISGDKIVKFSWHAGRGFAIVRWKTTVPAVGRKNSNSHTGAKSQSWTALRPKVLVNLHPLPHSFKAKPHPLPLKKARPAI